MVSQPRINSSSLFPEPLPHAATGSTPTAAPALLLRARLRRLLGSMRTALRALADQPLSLFLAVLALNALFRPYAHLSHDARLYAAQVLHRLTPGRFQHDLYFQFGSQDRFSAFSVVAAPLTDLLGLPLSFFVFYLLSNSLYLLALQRLLAVLIPDRLVAALAFVFAACVPLPFGGLSVFQLNENFFTPRILATALTLFGLERLLAGRPIVALALVLGGAALHPLMAFGGLLIWLAWCLDTYLRPRHALAVPGLLGTAVAGIIFYPPVGVRLLGYMDDTWRQLVDRVSLYTVPGEWLLEDWIRSGVALAVLTVVAMHPRMEQHLRRFLALVVAAGVLGVVGSLVAYELPYALPRQGQPWRVLWLVMLLQVPCAFWLAAFWWRQGTAPGRTAAVGLLCYLGATSFTPGQLLVLGAVVPLVALLLYRKAERTGAGEWLWWLALAATAAGILLTSVQRTMHVVQGWDQLVAVLPVHECLVGLPAVVDPLARVIVAAGLLALAATWLGTGRRFQVAAATLALGVPAAMFLVPQTALYRSRYGQVVQDAAFVRAFLESRPGPSSQPPTIYWPVGRLDLPWFEVGANVYFDWHQVAGNLFSRGTALEGDRRIARVRRFEIEQHRGREIILSAFARRSVRTLFRADRDPSPPDWNDLRRLSDDPLVDYAVLRQRFEGAVAATNGTWFIYDCRAIRAAQEKRAIDPAQLVSHVTTTPRGTQPCLTP